MRRTFIGVAVVAAGAAAVVSLPATSAAALPSNHKSTKTLSAASDPSNVVYSAEFEDGKVFNTSTTELSPEAFGKADVRPKDLTESTPLKVSKIQPKLAKLIKTGKPGRNVQVVITYSDKLRIPAFPIPNFDEGRSTPRNKEQIAEGRRLIGDIKAERAPLYDRQAKTLEGLGGKPLQQYWLIQGMRALMPLSSVTKLASTSGLRYVELADGVAGPPADSDPDNDTEDARAQISSDPYFNLGQTSGWIGLLDTGVRTTHTVFNNPDHIAITSDLSGDGDPTDQCNHGTSSAAEITGNSNLGSAWRGVSGISLDSWDVYGNDCLVGGGDVVTGFQNAVSWLDKVIVAEIQLNASETSASSTAADNAFDAGSVVIAANGNFGPGASTVRSPGNAHKAIGIGAADLETDGLMGYSGRGPTADGRYKPDLVFPTNIETARNSSDTAMGTFRGTSAATPVAGAAAALLRNWMRGGTGSIDAGHVYSQLILGGQQTWPFNNDTGAGPYVMGTNGISWWGKVSVGQGSQVNIPIPVANGRPLLEGALWWPETTSRHNDVDLALVDPSGRVVASSISGVSVFERAGVPRAGTGTWTLRITGFSVSGSQTVFWSARNR